MSDIINLLPDSVANQIAAGEVIQRPASVVKELVENAIDANSKNIQIVIENGGNTLIQVIDDGVGMSETDARMCFERHATSKINDADDLFALSTKGFRGEALASIASVAQVVMRSRQENDTLGTFIEMAGSRLFRQERVQTPIGTNIEVKNLFFNVPARRRFLKSTSTEMSHIRKELIRIVLAHPDVGFKLFDGKLEVLDLPIVTLKTRIEQVFGFSTISKNKLDQQLLPIHIQTDLITIEGFIGRPEFARKKANQYFFVNNRYMHHPYFHKSVLLAYDKMLKPQEYPNFFIYFQVNPETIDVNVHPSKTEIKFEDEQVIFSVLKALVKETLGKYQVMPTLDFDKEGAPDIPHIANSTQIVPPQIRFDKTYNPFQSTGSSTKSGVNRKKQLDYDWEQLYDKFNKSGNKESDLGDIEFEGENQLMHISDSSSTLMQLMGRFVVNEIEDGLLLIEQHRAHFRVLYDRFMLLLQNQKANSQQLLFAEEMNLDSQEALVFSKLIDDLEWIGFRTKEIDKNHYLIEGIPTMVPVSMAISVLRELIDEVDENGLDIKENIQNQIAITLSKRISIRLGQRLSLEEMQNLYDDLFSCENYQYSPDGKRIIHTLTRTELNRLFE